MLSRSEHTAQWEIQKGRSPFGRFKGIAKGKIEIASSQAPYPLLPHKCESSSIPLLVLSKTQTLRWFAFWFRFLFYRPRLFSLTSKEKGVESFPARSACDFMRPLGAACAARKNAAPFGAAYLHFILLFGMYSAPPRLRAPRAAGTSDTPVHSSQSDRQTARGQTRTPASQRHSPAGTAAASRHIVPAW